MRARRSPTAVHLLLLMLAVIGVGIGDAIGVGGAAPAAASTPVTPQIVTGSEHTCALSADGTVRCWGRNQLGQLGDGTTTSRSNPVQVVGLSGVTQLSAHSTHTCALLGDGTVRCWGSNGYGKLGDGTQTDASSPVTVVGLSGVTRIAAGGHHTCALLGDGTVRCWGLNDSGQVGNGTTGTTSTPVLSPASVTGLTGVSDVTTGQIHTCALLGDGTARCWGSNTLGRLGDGTTTDRNVPVEVLEAGSTQGTNVLGGITSISAGNGPTCATLSTGGGTARCWGYNTFGQLGDGTTNATANANPVTVLVAAGGAPLTGVTRVSAGTEHACAVLTDGTARCWGRGANGRLGDGATSDRPSPVAVSGLSGVTGVVAGLVHSCALVDADGGTLRCWGDGSSGRLGDGEAVQRNTPVAVLASGTASASPVVLVVGATASAGSSGAAGPVGPVGPSVGCAPAAITVGAEVTCTITGGDPGIDILWRAVVNPVIAEAGVTLDADGRGEFSFTVPPLADGAELRVELVEWTAPVSLGVVGTAGGPVPAAVPAGDGGVAAAVGVPGMAGAGAVAAAGLLMLLLATRVRPRRAHRS